MWPMWVIVALLLLVLIAASPWIILSKCRKRQRPLPHSNRALFIVAHPIDETMFFGPTIQGLREAGTVIYMVCVSSGNARGLGMIRKQELLKAFKEHGLDTSNLTILDFSSFQDGFVAWAREALAKVLLRFIQILDVDTVISFDHYGVSGHPNHTSIYSALHYLYSNSLIPSIVSVFVLESVPLWRKYAIPLDALVSANQTTFLYVLPPHHYLTIWRAMRAHASQLVWFRYLYVLFSRYALFNTLKRIPAPQRKNDVIKFD